MNTIIGFLIGCVALALFVGIGWFLLQVILMVGALLIGGVIAGVSWIWQKLTGN
jgi:hypothetical protein